VGGGERLVRFAAVREAGMGWSNHCRAPARMFSVLVLLFPPQSAALSPEFRTGVQGPVHGRGCVVTLSPTDSSVDPHVSGKRVAPWVGDEQGELKGGGGLRARPRAGKRVRGDLPEMFLRTSALNAVSVAIYGRANYICLLMARRLPVVHAGDPALRRSDRPL
jgi:hypothetical protein